MFDLENKTPVSQNLIKISKKSTCWWVFVKAPVKITAILELQLSRGKLLFVEGTIVQIIKCDVRKI